MTTAPSLSLHQLPLYNTGRMSPEQVIAAFAARRQQFDRIVADITAEKPKSRAQHHLVVGQRGMGKTMLLARMAAELRTNPNLSARFLPLVFAEEQYAVDRLSKFWLNCLDSLADAREAAGEAAHVEEIDATVARLTATGMRAMKDEQAFADEVYDAFAKASGATGQRTVLLVDNLQLVFERLDGREQHSLRELLMRPGSPVLVGTSPSPPSQDQDYSAAFYDQFKIHYLRPLDEPEMRSLLVHLADTSGRSDVRQRVLQHPARLKVLRQLTGGNPRTTLTLFFLYAEDFAPSVFGDLEGLLDRVTPLYKSRFEELTAQQQVVTSAVANHWDPITAAGIATATGLPAGTISSQLDRLEKLGVVERTELFGESRTGYQLAERFFNIWFLMRSASRRQRREVEFLTRFLESFYEPADRNRLARNLLAEDHFSPDRFVWSRAVAASLNEAETAEELRRHSELTALREEAREARARLRELIDFDRLPPAALAFHELRATLESLLQDGFETTPSEFAKAVLGDRVMFMQGERERLAAHDGPFTREEIQGILESASKTRVADEQQYSAKAVRWFSQRLASGQIRARRDVDDWNRAFHQAEGKEVLQLMVDTLPAAFGASLSQSSVMRVTAVLRPDPDARAWQWFNWAYDLHFKLELYSEAESAYRMAISQDAEDALAWTGLGFLLDRFGRFVEAESAFRNAILADAQMPGAWMGLGHLLRDTSDRFEEAERAYREAIARDPTHSAPWNGLGNLYCDYLDRFVDAAAAYENAIRLNPNDEVGHQNRLFLRRDFIAGGASARHLMTELRSLTVLDFPDTNFLHETLFAAYEFNWGLAKEALAKAIALRFEGLLATNTDDWIRATAVLIHLNYGRELLEFLEERGDTARLRPWVEAVRAVHIGDRRALQNVAPEIRTTAEIFYDGIANRLEKLPEKTRRRPLPEVRKRRRRQSR